MESSVRENMDSDQTSSLFDAYYYAHSCGSPVERNDAWLGFFASVADRIVSDIAPKTVLDAGCAWGFLVEALRKRGVEAWGVDISDYAIQNVHPSVKPYCWVGSIADPFPQKYDLIVTIEVLEHMPRPASERALANLCQFSDDILFSSTPFDYKEATHFNVQLPEYWAGQFAGQGFYRDVDFDAGFVTDWAARFTRKNKAIHQVVYDYERKFWQLGKENIDLRRLVNDLRVRQVADAQIIQELQARQVQNDERLDEMVSSQQALQLQISAWEDRWADLEKGSGWRLLEKFRRFRIRLFPHGSQRERWFYALIKRRS